MAADTTTATSGSGLAEQPHKTRAGLFEKGRYILYFKGSVLAEGENGAKLGAIGFAIFDPGNSVVCKESKVLALPEAEMTEEVAQLEAFVHGLKFALTLGIKRLVYSCLGFNVHSYVLRERINKKLRFLRNLVPRCYKPNTNQKPQDALIVKLVDSISPLKKRFQSCHSSTAYKNNNNLVLELVTRSIAIQAGKPIEEIVLSREKCPICLDDDVDSRKMFEIGVCHHRFCSHCLKIHVELKVRGFRLPECPHYNCRTRLGFEACRELLPQELHDSMIQLFYEASIPANHKVYCPNPRCSCLMSKPIGLSTTNMTKAYRCIKCQSLFCMNCKVLWHSNMSCYEYKKREMVSGSADAKLNILATQKKWRQCPYCSNMVERTTGCSLIHCRCGHMFEY